MMMAVGFKHTTFAILVIIVDIIAREPVMVEAVSLSSGGSDTSGHPTSIEVDNDQPTPSDLEQIEMLKDRIAKLQSDVTDIVQTFSSLDIVSKHPSMMRSLDVETRDGGRDGGRSRSRRDSDVSPGLSTEAQSSSTVQGAGSDVKLPNYPGYLGPYGGPMYSGQCFLCPAGTPGPRGAPGPAGLPGRDGRDGRDASLTSPAQYAVDNPHDSGQSSDSGNPGNEQFSTASRQQDPEVTSRNISHGGAVYTRWGKSDCADGAELIYTGTIGGAKYDQTGSGANHLCLPNDPIYDEFDPAGGSQGQLYSSEYETSNAPNQRIRDVHDHAPLCAVCRAPAAHTSVLMVPARNVCPSNAWRLEYAGYLMSAHHGHKRSEFICVDRALEAKAGTHGNQNGALLYMVESRCLVGGGLPCQPYIDGYELTCAMCTM